MRIARMLLVGTLVLGAPQLALWQANQENSSTVAGKPKASASQQKQDQTKIAVQQICPTSGVKLGQQGPPIKVRVGREIIFLCCKACLKKKIDPKHWGTIHANFAKAQRICPIMKKELPKNPKWTIVEGQIVYVCCPPCTKKIEAEPKAYVQRIDQLYNASLQEDKLRR